MSTQLGSNRTSHPLYCFHFGFHTVPVSFVLLVDCFACACGGCNCVIVVPGDEDFECYALVWILYTSELIHIIRRNARSDIRRSRRCVDVAHGGTQQKRRTKNEGTKGKHGRTSDHKNQRRVSEEKGD